jgi:hypothetical protein
MLTPALPNTASLNTELDSQLDRSLENRAEIHLGLATPLDKKI